MKNSQGESKLVTEARASEKAKAATALDRKVKKHALQRVEELEQQLSDLTEIRNGIHSYAIPSKKNVKSQAAAIWLASDWHVGEKVTLAQVNGINQYNPKIARKRAEAYFRNALRVTDIWGRDSEIDTVVLALLGD